MHWPIICKRVADAIQSANLIPPAGKVLVAISGGPDSVLLAFTLRHLGYSIGLAHVNYQLRGEDSDSDETLVRAYAHKWQVPVFVKKVDTKAYMEEHNLSLQDAARRLRYLFFAEIMDQEDFDLCATAHQRNDQVESILMSFLKGNNPSLLKGIPEQRGAYIRPFLGVRKTEILASLAENELEFGLDYTNGQNDYLRNQTRNQVLPILRKLNPSIDDQILERFDWYQQQYHFLEKILEEWLERTLTSHKGGVLLNWGPFAAKFGLQHLPLLVLAAGQKWGWHGYPLWRLLELTEAQSGKFIENENSRIFRREGGIWLAPMLKRSAKRPIHLPSIPKLAAFSWGVRKLRLQHPVSPPFSFGQKGVLLLDSSQLQLPLKIRSWKEGDRMRPLGMKGEKKLSDIFADEKFSPYQKENAIVIEDQIQIVALSDFRIAESVRVMPKTEKVLQIVIEEQN